MDTEISYISDSDIEHEWVIPHTSLTSAGSSCDSSSISNDGAINSIETSTRRKRVETSESKSSKRFKRTSCIIESPSSSRNPDGLDAWTSDQNPSFILKVSSLGTIYYDENELDERERSDRDQKLWGIMRILPLGRLYYDRYGQDEQDILQKEHEHYDALEEGYSESDRVSSVPIRFSPPDRSFYNEIGIEELWRDEQDVMREKDEDQTGLDSAVVFGNGATRLASDRSGDFGQAEQDDSIISNSQYEGEILYSDWNSSSDRPNNNRLSDSSSETASHVPPGDSSGVIDGRLDDPHLSSRYVEGDIRMPDKKTSPPETDPESRLDSEAARAQERRKYNLRTYKMQQLKPYSFDRAEAKRLGVYERTALYDSNDREYVPPSSSPTREDAYDQNNSIDLTNDTYGPNSQNASHEVENDKNDLSYESGEGEGEDHDINSEEEDNGDDDYGENKSGNESDQQFKSLKNPVQYVLPKSYVNKELQAAKLNEIYKKERKQRVLKRKEYQKGTKGVARVKRVPRDVSRQDHYGIVDNIDKGDTADVDVAELDDSDDNYDNHDDHQYDNENEVFDHRRQLDESVDSVVEEDHMDYMLPRSSRRRVQRIAAGPRGPKHSRLTIRRDHNSRRVTRRKQQTTIPQYHTLFNAGNNGSKERFHNFVTQFNSNKLPKYSDVRIIPSERISSNNQVPENTGFEYRSNIVSRRGKLAQLRNSDETEISKRTEVPVRTTRSRRAGTQTFNYKNRKKAPKIYVRGRHLPKSNGWNRPRIHNTIVELDSGTFATRKTSEAAAARPSATPSNGSNHPYESSNLSTTILSDPGAIFGTQHEENGFEEPEFADSSFAKSQLLESIVNHVPIPHPSDSFIFHGITLNHSTYSSSSEFKSNLYVCMNLLSKDWKLTRAFFEYLMKTAQHADGSITSVIAWFCESIAIEQVGRGKQEVHPLILAYTLVTYSQTQKDREAFEAMVINGIKMISKRTKRLRYQLNEESEHSGGRELDAALTIVRMADFTRRRGESGTFESLFQESMSSDSIFNVSENTGDDILHDIWRSMYCFSAVAHMYAINLDWTGTILSILQSIDPETPDVFNSCIGFVLTGMLDFIVHYNWRITDVDLLEKLIGIYKKRNWENFEKGDVDSKMEGNSELTLPRYFSDESDLKVMRKSDSYFTVLMKITVLTMKQPLFQKDRRLSLKLYSIVRAEGQRQQNFGITGFGKLSSLQALANDYVINLTAFKYLTGHKPQVRFLMGRITISGAVWGALFLSLQACQQVLLITMGKSWDTKSFQLTIEWLSKLTAECLKRMGNENENDQRMASEMVNEILLVLKRVLQNHDMLVKFSPWPQLLSIIPQVINSHIVGLELKTKVENVLRNAIAAHDYCIELEHALVDSSTEIELSDTTININKEFRKIDFMTYLNQVLHEYSKTCNTNAITNSVHFVAMVVNVVVKGKEMEWDEAVCSWHSPFYWKKLNEEDRAQYEALWLYSIAGYTKELCVLKRQVFERMFLAPFLEQLVAPDLSPYLFMLFCRIRSIDPLRQWIGPYKAMDMHQFNSSRRALLTHLIDNIGDRHYRSQLSKKVNHHLERLEIYGTHEEKQDYRKNVSSTVLFQKQITLPELLLVGSGEHLVKEFAKLIEEYPGASDLITRTLLDLHLDITSRRLEYVLRVLLVELVSSYIYIDAGRLAVTWRLETILTCARTIFDYEIESPRLKTIPIITDIFGEYLSLMGNYIEKHNFDAPLPRFISSFYNLATKYLMDCGDWSDLNTRLFKLAVMLVDRSCTDDQVSVFIDYVAEKLHDLELPHDIIGNTSISRPQDPDQIEYSQSEVEFRIYQFIRFCIGTQTHLYTSFLNRDLRHTGTFQLYSIRSWLLSADPDLEVGPDQMQTLVDVHCI